MDSIKEFKDKYRFLSNFYPVKVMFEWIEFPTVEHAFQAAKTTDIGRRKWMALAESPADAKRSGRRLSIRPDWEQIKLKVMEDLVRQKFSKEPLRTQLLETGDAELIEGNEWGDTFWGVCKGRGENWLGKILMMIRDEVGR